MSCRGALDLVITTNNDIVRSFEFKEPIYKTGLKQGQQQYLPALNCKYSASSAFKELE